MVRNLPKIFEMILLYIMEIGFIYSLPKPFDAIPIVLIISVFLYQYKMQSSQIWWLISFGCFLDLLDVSFVPFEVISFTFATVTMALLVQRVFTNRSFYGMTATAFLCTVILLISRISILAIFAFFKQTTIFWTEIILFHAWSSLFAAIFLLFILPVLIQVKLQFKRYLLRLIKL